MADDDFDDDSPEILPTSNAHPTKKRKRFSGVWQFFDLQQDKCVCKHCPSTFVARSSTTSLWYHVENAHPELLTKSPGSSASETIPFELEKAEQLLVKFIVSNYLSFRLINSESFRDLIEYLQPKWDVCDRKKLSAVLVPALRSEIEASLKHRMSSIKYFSISLDTWTSSANRSYLAVTAHGISKSFSFESFLLDIVVIKKSETGEHIAELVREILGDWSIDLSQIVAGTSDGGANVKKAIKKDLNLMWIYCLAHALNRSVRLGLDSAHIKSIVKKAKQISKFFRASPKASKVLLEQQKYLQVSTKKMTLDNKTRWGSAYEMMKRLVNSRPAISASLAIVTGTKKKPPSDLSVDEWEFLRQFVSVLEPLHEATKYLSKEKYPIISSVTPLFRRLFDYHLKTSDADDMCTNELKDTIREDLMKRWGCLLENMPDAFLLSIYLDPRLKDFSFVQDENQRRSLLEKAKNLCGQCLEASDGTALSQGELVLAQSMVEEEQESEKITAQKQRLAVLFGGIVEDSKDSADGSSLDELDLYHQKKAIPFAIENKVSNPLSWWKKNQSKYPRLAKLARQFLCVIASSVPCERVFSKSGWCVNKRRTLLSDANVSNLVFISSNLQ